MTISLTVAAQNLRAKIRSTPIILNLAELTTATDAAEAAAIAAAASQAAAAASASSADSSETDAETAQTAAAASAASAAADAATLSGALGAEVVTTSAAAGFTAERVLTDTTEVTKDVGTAAQVKLNLAAGVVSVQTLVTIAATDHVLIADASDSNNKKKALVSDILALPGPLPRGHIGGLTISNDPTDPTNDLGIAQGEARDSTNAQNIVLASSIIKRLDAAWAVGTNQGGLDTGSIANDTYHVWLIKRSDTGVVDVLYSVSPTAPTMPTNYDFKRLVGSFLRVGGAIVKFLQEGNYFWLETPVQDVAATNPGTAAVTRTLSIPTDRKLIAFVNVAGENGTNNFYSLTSSLDAADIAPSATVANHSVVSTGISRIMTGVRVRTNTSAQIRSRQSASGAADNFFIYTLGWIDSRGRDD